MTYLEFFLFNTKRTNTCFDQNYFFPDHNPFIQQIYVPKCINHIHNQHIKQDFGQAPKQLIQTTIF